MKKIEQYVQPGMIIVTVLVVLFVVRGEFRTYLSLREREVKIQAVADCAKTASSTWKDIKNNSDVTEPYKPAYDQCLQDKGY